MLLRLTTVNKALMRDLLNSRISFTVSESILLVGELKTGARTGKLRQRQGNR